MTQLEPICPQLPEPYYEHGGCTIYHGDCRDLLPHLEADVVVTDPPYGHGADRWTGGTWAKNPIYGLIKTWDSVVTPIEILMSALAGREGIVWGGNYFPLPVSRCWLAWMKASRMPTLADMELAWTSFNKPSKAFDEQRNPDGKRWHPTQKPLSLMKWCVRMTKGVILDPFMGSGTTLRAAKDLGRSCIGIEIEESYCEVAAKRLSQEVLDL